MKMKRLKFYGNIRFIGELFKLGMLTENIMHDCIYRLLKACDDDSLVSLCILLTTVGQLLDTDKAKNNWIQHHTCESDSLKIDVNHKVFKKEQFKKQVMQSQLPPRNDKFQSNIRHESRRLPKDLPRDEVEIIAKMIFKEFLGTGDLDKAKTSVKELEGQTYLEVLVSSCINDVLEKSKKERDITGQFFHEMVKNNLIPCVAYFKGLSEILQFAEDMVIDIPMIWTYLAQLIVPVLIGGSVPWSDLIQVLQTSLEKSCCLKLLTEILLHAKIITSEADVARMWQSSNLEWSQFVDPPNVTKFLEDKELQITISPVNESQLTAPTSLGE
ncbi:eukaryotic translation initiation factor 4 gamma 1-like isoform X2 [Physella acuta]|uniref:eukaryotic translation initiation factor 4 gamma 1-like isoform X2 n=1 Tax=Physella acuta TaxID=109671 RepID=UPI0027DCB506|nr:eukaryotic translation initiation factor 4 gamma 1-like isoform X2 [Physella acuta]